MSFFKNHPYNSSTIVHLSSFIHLKNPSVANLLFDGALIHPLKTHSLEFHPFKDSIPYSFFHHQKFHLQKISIRCFRLLHSPEISFITCPFTRVFLIYIHLIITFTPKPHFNFLHLRELSSSAFTLFLSFFTKIYSCRIIF